MTDIPRLIINPSYNCSVCRYPYRLRADYEEARQNDVTLTCDMHGGVWTLRWDGEKWTPIAYEVRTP